MNIFTKLTIIAFGLFTIAFVHFSTPESGSTEVQSKPEIKEPAQKKRETKKKPSHRYRVRPGQQKAVASSLQLGDRSVWKLESTRELAIHTEGTQDVAVDLTGTWVMTFVDEDEAYRHFHVQIPDAHIEMIVDGAKSLVGVHNQVVTRDLRTPFFVTIGRNGRIDALHFSPEVAPFSRTTLKGIASLLQAADVDAGISPWTTEESDPLGEYLAVYEMAPNGIVAKNKTEYLRMASFDGLSDVTKGQIEVIESLMHFSIQRSGLIQDLDHRETVQVRPGFGIEKMVVNMDVVLEWIDRDSDMSLVHALTRQWDGLQTVGMTTQERELKGSQDHDAQILAGATFEQLMLDVGSLPNDRKYTPASSKLLQKTRALLRLDPAEALRVKQAIYASDNPEARGVLVGALGDAGTPEAQTALVDLAYDNPLEGHGQHQAIAALGMSEAPTPETLQAIGQGIASTDSEIANTSALALGNTIKTILGDGSTSAVDEAVEQLIALYEGATTVEEQIIALTALGNTADARALPSIEEALMSSVSSVRGAAVTALRFQDMEGVDGAIDAVMLNDPSYGVRRDAITAASYRDVSVHLGALGYVVQNESNATVRLDAVVTLGQKVLTVPGADSLLAWASDHDPEIAVRDKANIYLKTVGSSVSL